MMQLIECPYDLEPLVRAFEIYSPQQIRCIIEDVREDYVDSLLDRSGRRGQQLKERLNWSRLGFLQQVFEQITIEKVD